MVDLDELTPRRHAPHLLDELLKHPEWERGAEIGVAMGRTLLHILRNTDLHMIAVDAFEYLPDSENSGLYEDLPHETNEVCVRAIAEHFPGRVEIMKGVSWRQAHNVEDESLDFVFIDASHMYLEVKLDILAWAPKVRPGGLIMGHDYCERWDGVRRAVNEKFGTPDLLAETIWYVPKR